ncbi:MAG: hypothetical protein ACKO23_17960 [Gemmataceae bacterium]
MSGLIRLGSDLPQPAIEIIKDYPGDDQSSPVIEESSSSDGEQAAVVSDENGDLQEFQVEKSTLEFCELPLPQFPEGEFDPRDPTVWVMSEPVPEDGVWVDPVYTEGWSDPGLIPEEWNGENTWYYRSGPGEAGPEEFTDFDYSDPGFTGEEWMFWTTGDDLYAVDFTGEEYTDNWENYPGEFDTDGEYFDRSGDLQGDSFTDEKSDYVMMPMYNLVAYYKPVASLGAFSFEFDPVRTTNRPPDSWIKMERSTAERLQLLDSAENGPVGSSSSLASQSGEGISVASESSEVELNGNSGSALAIALDRHHEEKTETATDSRKPEDLLARIGSTDEVSLLNRESKSEQEEGTISRKEPSANPAEFELPGDSAF